MKTSESVVECGQEQMEVRKPGHQTASGGLRGEAWRNQKFRSSDPLQIQNSMSK